MAVFDVFLAAATFLTLPFTQLLRGKCRPKRLILLPVQLHTFATTFFGSIRRDSSLRDRCSIVIVVNIYTTLALVSATLPHPDNYADLGLMGH